MSNEITLARQVESLTKRIAKKSKQNFINKNGNYYSILVSGLTVAEKRGLEAVINDFMRGRDIPLRKLQTQRRNLLLKLLKTEII